MNIKTQKQLEIEIIKAAEAYYEGEPLIPDEEFDALVEELKEAYPGSPVLVVGWGYAPKSNKIKHKSHVGGLSKIRTLENIKECVLEASIKLDGMTIVVNYDNDGKLETIVTRGDGSYGVDVTERLRWMMPDEFVHSSIRGELCIKKDVFTKYMSQAFANPRNAVSGILFSKTDRQWDKYLSFVVFDKIFGVVFEGLSIPFETVQTAKFVYIRTGIPDSFIVIPQMEYWKNNSPYPADGVVLDNVKPKVAFKFATESVEGEVSHIEWNLSPKGRLIPVVQLKEPVSLYGTKVSRVAAYHYRYVLEHMLGRGAKILITKANEIIPHITGVVQKASVMEMPVSCPKCNGILATNGMHAMCENCVYDPEVLLRNFIGYHYIVDGMGGSLINAFIEHCLEEKTLTALSKFLKDPEEDKWLHLNSAVGIGVSKIKMLKEAMNPNKVLDQTRLLASLNLPDVGGNVSKTYAPYIETIALGATLPKFSAISYRAKGSLSKYHAVIRAAYELFSWKMPEIVESKGINVVITGKLSVKRAVFAEECEDHGIVVQGGIGKDTTYLVTDDPNSGSSKNKKADSLGVKKINEEELRKIW